MRRPSDEDLFKDTTMTFGEHLEELRGALFRALIGLAIGVMIGFIVGNYVVELIERPLIQGLRKYHVGQNEEKLQKFREQAAELGIDNPQRYESAVADGFAVDEKFVDPEQLFAQLRKRYPSIPAAPPADVEALKTYQDEAKAAEQAGDPPPPYPQAELVPVLVFSDLDEDPRLRPTTFSALEAFMIYMKAALITGVILSGPWIFYQLWMFVAAGLYPHEKHYVHVFLPFSVVLFFAGVGLAFFWVFEPVLEFLFSFNARLGFNTDMRISEWISFMLFLPLGFGVAFQLPLVMLFLERIGVFTIEMYLEKWRIAVLVIAVLSAVLTPADPMSMILLAGPLVVLYFGAILLCRFMPRGEPQSSQVSH
ncbi:MAG: twin-arginine translocase subunit TatC [Planctomycetales bacterium]|nr:twin-arginine translocase subunit TatC [Planctomycetales bacterium]